MSHQRATITPLAAIAMTLTGMCLPWAHIGRLSVSGWNGSANLLGVPCPGSFVALVAGLAVGCLYTVSPDGQKTKWFLPLALSAYGIFHSGFMAVALNASRGISVGVGIPITMLSFTVIVFCVFQQQILETSSS